MKRILVITLIIFSFIFAAGCNSKEPKEYMIFGEGQNWSAQCIKTLSAGSARDNSVTFSFSYKGTIDDLKNVKRVVFSYGTSEGNIAETVNFENGMDRGTIPVEFKEDFITDIIGKNNEKILVIIDCGGKEDSFNLKQYGL